MTNEQKKHLTNLGHLRSVAERSHAFTADVASTVADVLESMSDPTVVFYSKTKPPNMTANDLWVKILD